MGVIAEAVKHMLAGGMSAEAVVQAVAAMEAAQTPPLTARQQRNRRYYESKASEKRLKASESDASDGKRLNSDEYIPSPPSDGFPPHPLSLTSPSPLQKTPYGGKKGSPNQESEESKAMRLPFDNLPDEWGRWAIAERGWGKEVVQDVWSNFRDHWRGKAGNAGKKSDWLATWRNWCRKENIKTQPFKKQEASYGAGKVKF